MKLLLILLASFSAWAVSIPSALNFSNLGVSGGAGGGIPDPSLYVTQTFNTAGTHNLVIPADVAYISVTAAGGGGGGGPGGGGANYGGGGGGGGAHWSTEIIKVTPGTTYTVVVGAGGASGTAGNPTYLNNPSAALVMRWEGGNAGVTGLTSGSPWTGGAGGAAKGNGGAGGAGGTGSNPGGTGSSGSVGNRGALSLGAPGNGGVFTASYSSGAGGGGGSSYGAGGNGSDAAANNKTAGTFGGGGGGGQEGNSGGAGGDGIFIASYYTQ